MALCKPLAVCAQITLIVYFPVKQSDPIYCPPRHIMERECLLQSRIRYDRYLKLTRVFPWKMYLFKCCLQ